MTLDTVSAWHPRALGPDVAAPAAPAPRLVILDDEPTPGIEPEPLSAGGAWSADDAPAVEALPHYTLVTDDAQAPDGVGDVDGAEAPQAPVEPLDMANDYSIISKPRIGLQAFSAILSNAGSPAAGEAAGIYSAAVKYGVDPAVLLAIFQHESGFGRAGRAKVNKSLGNSRYYPSGKAYGAVNNDGFNKYPTWTAAAEDASRLLRVYGQNGIRKGKQTDTVRTLPFVWAPSSDGNAPASYGASLAHHIQTWTGKAPNLDTVVPTGGKAKAKAKAKAPKAAKAAATGPQTRALPFLGYASAQGAPGADLTPLLIIGAFLAAAVVIVIVSKSGGDE